MKILITSWVIVLAVACAGCASGSPSESLTPSPTSPSLPSLPTALVFTHAPLDPSAISSITPLGNLNPPGHTLPTNHIYFGLAGSAVPVMAPAAGTVQVAARGADDSLLVSAATGVSYTLAHITLDPGMTSGTALTGGQRVGVTSGLASALDLGVTNLAVTLFFVRPDRYIAGTLHADSPLKYFQEPIRSQLYGLVNRVSADKDGKIDFDVASRLSGNWFLEGLPAADTELSSSGPKHLAFARDVRDPSLVRISIGGSLSVSGAFYVPDGTPNPADISPSSGLVAYRLLTDSARLGTGVGLLIVQMTASDRIQVETFPGAATSAAFTGAALTYTR